MGVVFFDEQRHVRRFRPHPRYHGGEQVRRHGEDGAHPQRRAELVALAHGHLLEQVGLLQDPLGLGDDRLRLGGDHHLPGAPFEQRHAELLLQLFDRRAQRRLADVADLGGVAEMTFPGQCDQIA